MYRFLGFLLLAGAAAWAQCPCPPGASSTRAGRANAAQTTHRTVAYNSADRVAEGRERASEEVRTLTLRSGTPITVRLEQSLDTKYDRSGTPFVARASRPVVVDGEVVVPRGALCRGHVVESKPSGRLKGRAVMGLALDTVETRGRIYRVATNDPAFWSGGHKKHDALWIGGGAGTGAGIGAIAAGGVGAAIGAGAGAAAGTAGALITGRRNLHLPVETAVVFTLRKPVAVREKVLTASR